MCSFFCLKININRQNHRQVFFAHLKLVWAWSWNNIISPLQKQAPEVWEKLWPHLTVLCTNNSNYTHEFKLTIWVSATRFTAAGRGEWHPIADNATAEGREANRRVEVVIHPAEDKA